MRLSCLWLESYWWCWFYTLLNIVQHVHIHRKHTHHPKTTTTTITPTTTAAAVTTIITAAILWSTFAFGKRQCEWERNRIECINAKETSWLWWKKQQQQHCDKHTVVLCLKRHQKRHQRSNHSDDRTSMKTSLHTHTSIAEEYERMNVSTFGFMFHRDIEIVRIHSMNEFWKCDAFGNFFLFWMHKFQMKIHMY